MPAKTHRTPSPLSGSQRKLRHEQVRMAKLGIPQFRDKGRYRTGMQLTLG